MSLMKSGGIRDIEIFGFSIKRSVRTIVALGVVAIGLSIISSAVGLALLSIKFISWIVFMPISAVAWIFGFHIPGFLSLALWGGALYGVWKYLKR